MPTWICFRHLGPVIFALLFSGCLPQSPDAPDLPDTGPDGTVTGYVVQVGDHLEIVDSPERAPAGSTPIAEGSYAVHDFHGRAITNGTLDAAGKFNIEVPAGFHSIEFAATGSSVPSLVRQITCIPSATIRLGQTHTVDRSDAVTAALQAAQTSLRSGSADSWLVLATLQPLPERVLVEPHGTRGSSAVHTTASQEWLIFIDKQPEAWYAHPVEYVFVDAASGAVKRVPQVFSSPQVNGIGFWSDSQQYVAYEGWPTDNDLDPVPLTSDVTISPEVVQMPLVPGSSSVLQTLDRDRAPVAGQEDVFALLVRGGNEDAFVANAVNFYEWLTGEGVPKQNIDLTSFPRQTLTEGFNEWNSDRTRIFERINARLEAGGKPTLIYYLTGHSYKTEDTCEPYGEMEVLGTDGDRVWGAGNLALDKAKACNIVIIWETCFSELLAEASLLELGHLVEDERADVKAFAASSRDGEAFGYRGWHDYLSRGSLKMGGLFTNAWIQNVRIVGNTVTGYLDTSGALIPELAHMETLLGSDQTPVYLHQPGDAPWCRPPPLLVLDQDELTFVRTNSGSCPGSIGNVVVRNQSNEVVTWSSSSAGAVITQPSQGTLAPGAEQQVEVLFDCSDFRAQVTDVIFTAQGSDTETRTRLTVELDITVSSGTADRSFSVRHPGPLGTTKITLWLPIPDGSAVDSSRIVDTSTQEPPAAAPWLPASPLTWSVAEGFRPDFTTWYGIDINITNNVLNQCSCPTLEWNYQLWYSFPMGER